MECILTFSVLLNFVMMVVAFLLYTISVRFMLERNSAREERDAFKKQLDEIASKPRRRRIRRRLRFVGPMFKGAWWR